MYRCVCPSSHGHPLYRVKYHYRKVVSSHFGITIPTSATIFIAPHLSSKIAGWIPHIVHMKLSFLTSLIWQVAHGVSAFLLDHFLRPAGSDIQFSMSSNCICDIRSSHYHFRPLYRHSACKHPCRMIYYRQRKKHPLLSGCSRRQVNLS